MKYGDDQAMREILAAVTADLSLRVPRMADSCQEAFLTIRALEVPPELEDAWTAGRAAQVILAAKERCRLTLLLEPTGSEELLCAEEKALSTLVARLRGLVRFYAALHFRTRLREESRLMRAAREATGSPTHSGSGASPVAQAGAFEAWKEIRLKWIMEHDAKKSTLLRRKCQALWNQDVAAVVAAWLHTHGVPSSDIGCLLDYLADRLPKLEVARKHGMTPQGLSMHIGRLFERLLGRISGERRDEEGEDHGSEE